MADILISCSYGNEDPERAILSFIFGNVAAAADQPTAVLLTIEGVRLATKGYTDDIRKEGFPPLQEVMQSFLSNGGQIWACGTCAKPRGITEDDLIEGARIVTAAYVVQYIASGASTIGF
ncbi:MAG: DsrE family protein [Chloroflexota bacterium]